MDTSMEQRMDEVIALSKAITDLCEAKETKVVLIAIGLSMSEVMETEGQVETACHMIAQAAKEIMRKTDELEKQKEGGEA